MKIIRRKSNDLTRKILRILNAACHRLSFSDTNGRLPDFQRNILQGFSAHSIQQTTSTCLIYLALLLQLSCSQSRLTMPSKNNATEPPCYRLGPTKNAINDGFEMFLTVSTISKGKGSMKLRLKLHPLSRSSQRYKPLPLGRGSANSRRG